MNKKLYNNSGSDGRGLKAALSAMKLLISSREVIYQLTYRDFAVRYRQSLLGYVWAVLPQLVTVAIFTFLAGRRVFDMGETTMPYVIHAMWSISLWQLFSSCIMQTTNSLLKAGSLVTKVNFPKESIVISALGEPIFDFFIRLVPLFIVMIWYGFMPAIQALWILPLIVTVVVFALGLGFVLSVFNLVVRDMSNIIGMLLTFGIFLAPILYPPPVSEPFVLINYVNPFSPLLITSQNLLAGVPLAMPVYFGCTVVLSFFACYLGWRVFCIAILRVAERA